MPGDAVTVFTPDDTHFAIAKEAIQRGLHVLITKPAVKTLAEHAELLKLVRLRAPQLCLHVAGARAQCAGHG